MRTRTSHRLLIGLLIGAMTMSAGCSAEQLQRVRETIDVADKAVDTTRKAVDTVEEGAKVVACLREKKMCPKESAANHNTQSDAAL